MSNDAKIPYRHLPIQKLCIWTTGALLLTGCASVQVPVAQFGTAISSAKTSETAYLTDVEQSINSSDNLSDLTFSTYYPPANYQTDPTTHSQYLVPATPVISADAMTAINSVLQSLQAYSQAMLNLSNYSTTTLDNNIDGFVADASNTNLTPLVGSNLLSSTQASALSKALSALANMIVQGIAANDVKNAASLAEPHLQVVINSLEQINRNYVALVQHASFIASVDGRTYWNANYKRLDVASLQSLQSSISAAEQPVTPEATNSALDAILKANQAIAASGPNLSKAEIQNAYQTAQNAIAAYKSLVQK